jgi:hypothetical protein
MKQWVPFEKQISAQFISWRPMDPFSVEACQADRKELGRFATQVWKEQRVGLRPTGRLFRYGSNQPGLLTNIWDFDARVALGLWSTPGKNLKARMYRLIGAIGDEDWKRLLSGSTLTAGQLGVTDELKDVLCQEMGTIPEGPYIFPELYLHPSELYQQQQLSQTPISVQALNTPLIQDWPQRDDRATMWAPLTASDGKPVIFRRIGLSFQNGKPEPASNREQYEKVLSRRQFRVGHAEDTRVTVGLPQRLFIEMRSRGYGISETDPASYSDLRKDLRDFLWEAAKEDVLAQIKILEEGARTGESLTQNPPPPPR